MNWRRFLCLIGLHKPVLVIDLPWLSEKAIFISGGPPLSVPIDNPWREPEQFKVTVVCLWCEKDLKHTTELRQGYIQEEK